MMRRTAVCAGLALGLFLSSWITLEKVVREATQPLSLEGIEVVVLQRTAADIQFTSRPSDVRYDPSTVGRMVEYRKGRVLVLHPELEGYHSVEVRLPPTVRGLVVEMSAIEVAPDLPMSALEVRSIGELTWKGDIARLLIDDRSPLQNCTGCGNQLAIYDGTIRELRISTQRGEVMLAQPDTLDRITLVLGEEASYTLGSARRVADLRILPWQAGIIEAKPPEPDPK